MNPFGTIKQIEILKDSVKDSSVYPWNIPSIKNLNGPLEIHPKITIITGDNGIGKSTLINGIAGTLGLNLKGGPKNLSPSKKTAYPELSDYLRISRVLPIIEDGFYFRSDTFHETAIAIDKVRSPHVDTTPPLHKQSHGQSIKSLIMDYFRGNQLLLLDEPEVAIHPSWISQIRKRLEDLAAAGSQIIMVTHSPKLASIQDALMYEFRANYIQKVNYFDSVLYRYEKSNSKEEIPPPT